MLLLAAGALAGPPRDAPDTLLPERLWDITHLELDVRIDPVARTVAGSATHTLERLGRSHDHVRLHQEALDITGATVDGAPAELTVGDGWVDVRLPPGERHVVRLDYTATPAKGLYFRGPAWDDGYTEVYSQGEDEDNRWWFPTWDHPSDTFTVTTHVTVPRGLEARGLGPLTSREDRPDGFTRWSFEMGQPVVSYLVTVTAGAYDVLELDGPLPIEVLVPPGSDPARVRASMAPVAAQVRVFTERFGPLPYPLLRFVFVQRYMWGGMENPTLTLLAHNILAEHDDPLNLRHSEDVLAHEVAHHWFGDLVTCHGWNPWWLNEGFARFYENEWAAIAHGAEAGAVSWDPTFTHAAGQARALEPDAASREKPVATWMGSYDKGAAVLQGLRVMLGADVFDAGVRLYVDRHRLGLVEGEDLRRAFEDASGRPLRWYFDQWVYGKGTAAWTVADRWKDGQLELTITPKGDGPVFHVPLTVEVGLPDGPVERTVWLDGTPVKLVVPAAREPLFVAVDPERGVPGTLEHTQSPARWLAQLQGSKHAQARLVALTHLGEGDPEPDVLDALEALATSGVDVTLRSRAVRALGGHGADERAEGFLLARLDDPQALVRREAVRGLPATPASLAALERALDDPHGWVRSAAFSRLEEHDPDRATEVAGRILKRADPSRVGYLHFLAIHRLADAGVVGSVPSFTADPRALVRRAALYATAELIREAELSDRERVRLQRVLADAIAVALQDPELRVREDAVEAARALRLTDIPMLERFVADNPIPELDTAARTSIAAIRNPAPDDDGLAKRLDALVERMDAMQGALDGAVERLDALGPQ